MFKRDLKHRAWEVRFCEGEQDACFACFIVSVALVSASVW